MSQLSLLRFAVVGVSAEGVQPLAGRQVRLGHGDHVHPSRPRQRLNGGLAEEDGLCDRAGHLEMAQVIGGVKAVERTCTELVEVEVVPLLGVLVLGQDVDTGAGLGSHNVVDRTAELAELLDIVCGGELVDVPVVVALQHAALVH